MAMHRMNQLVVFLMLICKSISLTFESNHIDTKVNLINKSENVLVTSYSSRIRNKFITIQYYKPVFFHDRSDRSNN